MHINFYISRSLYNINTIEHGEEAEELERLFEAFLNLGEYEISDAFGGSGDSKIIDLAEKENGVTIDGALV